MDCTAPRAVGRCGKSLESGFSMASRLSASWRLFGICLARSIVALTPVDSPQVAALSCSGYCGWRGIQERACGMETFFCQTVLCLGNSIAMLESVGWASQDIAAAVLTPCELAPKRCAVYDTTMEWNFG
eukprot:453684-Amphidinium_carterae.1